MPVLVSDTSVLINLERGSFLEHVFLLPFEFAVPDLLYEIELKDHGGPKLIDMGLRVEELDGAAECPHQNRRAVLTPPKGEWGTVRLEMPVISRVALPSPFCAQPLPPSFCAELSSPQLSFCA